MLQKLGAQITFCCYGSEADKINAKAINGDFFIIHHSTKNTKSRLVRSLLDKKPIYIRKHFNENIKDTFRANLSDSKFDLILVHHSAMAELGLFAGEIFNAPVALRLDNVEYMIWERYYKSLSSWNPLKYYIKRQANLLKKAEQVLFAQVDLCLAITAIDEKRALELSPNANVVISYNGIDTTKWQSDNNVKRDFTSMALATTYKWVHNTNGMKWFVESVLPNILKEIPDAKLRLYGSHIDEVLAGYEKPGLEKAGFVDNIQSELSRAGIYVAPLHVGSGIRIKILEAMALGLPVVATGISAEGIFATNDDGLFVSDSPAEQTRIIIELMHNPNEILRLGVNARKFIVEHFNDEKNYKKMLQLFDELIKKK